MNKKKNLTKKKFIEYMDVYLMLIPVVAFFLVFSYFPMYGIVISFKDFYASKGILGSEWLHPFYKNFTWLFSQEYFSRALLNTLKISILKLIFCFPVPIILSLFLAEMQNQKVKRGVQVCLYLPFFISWASIAGIIYSLLAVNGGLVNNIIFAFGGERVSFLTEEKYFYTVLIIAELWKNAGWGTVTYIAAITNVNPELYEVAKIDGCTRIKTMWYITLPCISPIIVVMFIMAVGGLLNAGFDPIFNLYNPSVYSVADILDTYVYRLGISSGQYEKAAALGLFKSVINVFMLVGCDRVIKKITGQGMYE